jgi:hypothetical protein
MLREGRCVARRRDLLVDRIFGWFLREMCRSMLEIEGMQIDKKEEGI